MSLGKRKLSILDEAEDKWDANKMLDHYMQDYLERNNFWASAIAFKKDAHLSDGKPEMIESPKGLLYEWWIVFWKLFVARYGNQHSDSAASTYIEAQQLKMLEHLHQMRNLIAMQQQGTAQLHESDGSSLSAMRSARTMGLPAASVLEGRKHPNNSKGPEASLTQVNAYGRMATSNAATSHQGQLFIGRSSGVISNAVKQIQAQSLLTTDINGDVYLGSLPMGLPMDPIAFHETMSQLSHGLSRGGLNQGNSSLFLKGWPLTGFDQLTPSVGAHVQKPSLTSLSQIQEAQWQRALARAHQTQNNLENPVNIANKGPRGLAGLAQGCLRAKDGRRSVRIQEKSSSNENFIKQNMEQVGDNDESSLPCKGGDGENVYGTRKQSLNEKKKETKEVFEFDECGWIRASDNIVTCCNFSSDGKFLASAGHDRKVVLWNKDSLMVECTPKGHSSFITDVCFRPNSYGFATSSTDESIRLWDATNPSYCVREYSGHNSPIASLDFHPLQTDLCCFLDFQYEISYWNINTSACSRVIKGGNSIVRFQPGSGKILATAYDKGVSIFDVETGQHVHSFQGGHSEEVTYICWDSNGEYLASVSKSLVNIWSYRTKECVTGINSYGEHYYCCVFHPSYSNLLLIGRKSSLELWNMVENKQMIKVAHENIISALVQCPTTKMLASASHDGTVKLWK